MGIVIREIAKDDGDWVRAVLKEHWGASEIVSRGAVHDASLLPGFIAVMDATKVGLLTYCIVGGRCEIVTLNALVEKKGVGSSLLAAVRHLASARGCEALWLITTNDNTYALRFYQKHGFVLVAIHCNAIDESRVLKPEIPLVGLDNIPIRDEIELKFRL
jgi:GNAT superfamily N-acetyltransferase